MTWKWVTGAATTAADLGNPVTTDDSRWLVDLVGNDDERVARWDEMLRELVG